MAHPSNSGGESAIQAFQAHHGDRLRSFPAHVAVIDAAGAIRLVNPTWRSFSRRNGGDDRGYLGENYLEVCSRSAGDDPDAADARDGVIAVLEGELPAFSMEYPCHGPSEQRWFRMDVAPLDSRRSGFIVSHTDITQVKLQTLALQEMAASVRATLAETEDARPAPEKPRAKPNVVGDQLALGEMVAEAHYLAARLSALVKRDDFAAKEPTEFAAAMINQWATAIGVDLFAGKNFFDGDSGSR